MFFVIILTRILFIACMIFIIGYVFGNFSRSRTLNRITRVASILAILFFLAGNAILFRSGYWRRDHRRPEFQQECFWENKDTTINR